MKLVAYILIGSLMFLGANRFMENMDHYGHQTEISCEMDCCDAHEDCEDNEGSAEHDHACPPDCNCNCHFHIVAIEYQFINISTGAPMALHFGSYSNRYHFEFATPVFEPPRFG